MTSKKKEMITFSILVPVYQVEDYVEECIQSVLKQTYQNWELILVDDGSRDRSGEICDRYAEQYENIHVYHKENRGTVHTRKYGIDCAKGDFCLFLDSDDTLKPNTLEVIEQSIRKYDCDCVIYGYERILDGQVFEQSEKEEECCIADKREVYRKVFLKGAQYNALWRKAVRRSVFQGKDYSNYYHVTMGDDLLQSLEILEYSRKVAFIEDRLYNYRLRSGSITETVTAKNYVSYMLVMQKCLVFLKRQNVFTERDYREYRSSCLIFICSYLYAICLFRTSVKNKVTLFQRLKASKYYQEFLMADDYEPAMLGRRHKLILMLFFKGQYRMLIVGISLYKFLRTRYRKLIVSLRNRK